jgi:hypothetical protein
MADIIQDRAGDQIQLQGGMYGFMEYFGIGQFNAADASGDLKVPIGRILDVQLTPLGAPAADEILSVNEAAALNKGVLTRPADNRLTITRTGAVKTNGLRFFYRVRGLPG